MASKKPAKPMAGQSKQVTLDPAIYGTTIKYMGDKNSPVSCSHCRRSIVRGMIRLRGQEYICSLTCAEQSSKIVKETQETEL
jgi:hypothetical protein